MREAVYPFSRTTFSVARRSFNLESCFGAMAIPTSWYDNSLRRFWSQEVGGTFGRKVDSQECLSPIKDSPSLQTLSSFCSLRTAFSVFAQQGSDSDVRSRSPASVSPRKAAILCRLRNVADMPIANLIASARA